MQVGHRSVPPGGFRPAEVDTQRTGAYMHPGVPVVDMDRHCILVEEKEHGWEVDMGVHEAAAVALPVLS